MEEGVFALDAALYGQGGSWKGDKGHTSDGGDGGGVIHHDLSTPEGVAALRSMGF